MELQSLDAREASPRRDGTPVPRLSVVLPTRNEAGNLHRLQERLEAVLADISHEVIVVDDSTDGETRPLLSELASGPHRWRVIERPPERQTGLATAVTEGIELAAGDAVCVMDADLQHPPAVVPQLLEAVERSADLAVGSRYTRGGDSDGLAGAYRRAVSGGSRLTAYALFPESRRTSDPLSGLFCVRRSAVSGRGLRPVGFKILLEVLVRCPELRVVDVPFVFGSRHAGESKADARQGLLYLRHLGSLFVRVSRSSLRLELGLIALASLAGFAAAFGMARMLIGPLIVAWLLASLASSVANAGLQRAVKSGRAGRVRHHRTLVLATVPLGLLLYGELLRLRPGHPLAAGLLAQGAVLAVPLALGLVAVRRAPAGPPLLPNPAAHRPASVAAGGCPPAGDAGPTTCSVGVMAHNEEANIVRTLRAILRQESASVHVAEVIVVASGCTDGTVAVVRELAGDDRRVRVCVQERREGKASAINLFLKQAASPVVVLSGADVIPEASALEHLCRPFQDPAVGMAGGRPVPVNDPYTFMGHTVHLLWRLHDYLARSEPKLGELVAFRNVISGIPADTSVDEISIQALISQLGYRLVYEPGCIVYNKGPVTVRDFLKQRRRIYAGHLQVREQQRYEAPTMQVWPILRQLIACRHFTLGSPRRAVWTVGTVFLEGLARVQGHHDHHRKRAHHIWQMVESTKDLKAGPQGVRSLCTEQSVLVFRFVPQADVSFDVYQESGDHQASEATRKLLPLVRGRIRREDKLSISGPGIVTAVLRVEQQEAEAIAMDIQETVQSTPVHLGIRGREVRVAVVYSVLTFVKARTGDVTVRGPALPEAVSASPGAAVEAAAAGRSGPT